MAQPPQINSVRTPDKAVVDATRSRRFPSLNLPLVVVVALLAGYGLVVVYSAVYGDPDYSFPRQAALVAVGAVVMIVLWRFDYRRLSEFTTLFLIVNVVLILSPHIPGLGTDAGMGSQSWIKLGPLQVQPGEFAKITVILLDASVMARYGGRLDDLREYLKALGIMLVPFSVHHDAARPGHGPRVPVHRRGGARGGRRAAEVPARHAGCRHRGRGLRVRARRGAGRAQRRRHGGVQAAQELPARPPARVPGPRHRTRRATATT